MRRQATRLPVKGKECAEAYGNLAGSSEAGTWQKTFMNHLLAGVWARMTGRATLVIAAICVSVIVCAQGYVPGRLLVKFTEGTPSVRANWVVAAANGWVESEVPKIGLKVVRFSGNTNLLQMARTLRFTQGVEYAEPDYYIQPAQVTPNDALYAGSQASYFNRISAPTAWGITTGSPSVVVAVLDTGVDGTHPDLLLNLVGGWNVQNNSSDTSDAWGHGTSTAGTVAATSNNSIGVASMAWGCKIMPIRITSSTSSSASSLTIAQGLIWAADHGANVANISFNAGGNGTVGNGAQYFRNLGGVVTISAGNSSTNLTYEPNPNYLLVGASNASDGLSSYSNYGTPLAFLAPGEITSTTRGGGYSGVAGTSFSSPMAAGLLALMKSANPNLTGTRLMELIQENCDDLGVPGWDPTYGHGRINAFKAVDAALNDGGDVTAPTVSITSPANGATVSGTVSVAASASDSGSGMSNVTLTVDGASLGADASAPYAWSWNTTSLANGNHVLVATARDVAGNTSTATITVNVQNADVTPPTVSITSPANGATVSGTITVSASASDSGSGMSNVTLTVDGASMGPDTAAPYAWNLVTTALTNGNHVLVATARDVAGNTASATITINVQNADVTPPTVSITSPTNGATVSGTVSVAASASDSGSGMSNVTLTVDGASLGADTSAPFAWSWNTTSLANGNHVLVATARDVAGNTATATITVNVQNADVTPPTVSITSPANGATVSGTISVTASASDSGSGMSNVTLTVDGASMGPDTAAPYAWNLVTTALTNGNHVLVATARDVAGNTASATITINVQNADVTPPTVSITSPAIGATVSGTITVTASASDSGSGMSNVTLTVDGASMGPDTAAPYAWNLVTTALTNGNHVLVATARDVAGNTASATITINVQNADVTPPTIVITSPTGGYMGRLVKVMVSAADNIAVTKVELYVDGVRVATNTVSPFAFFYDTNSLVRGNHTFQCKAFDAANNSSWSQVVVVRK